MRLKVTTATTASADRELLSNRIVVARHISANSRKVNVWPSSRIMRTFFFIFVYSIRPCETKSSPFASNLSSARYCIALALRYDDPLLGSRSEEVHIYKGF